MAAFDAGQVATVDSDAFGGFPYPVPGGAAVDAATGERSRRGECAVVDICGCPWGYVGAREASMRITAVAGSGPFAKPPIEDGRRPAARENQ